MSDIKKEGKYFLLEIDQRLASEDYLRQFLDWLEFRAMTRELNLSPSVAEQLAASAKENWWLSNKDRFLKG